VVKSCRDGGSVADTNDSERAIHLASYSLTRENRPTEHHILSPKLSSQMEAKPTILLIESSVQAIDVERRRKLANDFNLIHYDCESTSQFIEELKPGGRFTNIVAIIRNGWHKAGKFANHAPFATEIVLYFPPSLKIICCSGHGYDAADIPAITARGIWYCNTPNACTEAVANTALSLVLDSFRHLSFAQWCARNDWMQSRELGLTAVDPFGKSVGIVGLGDIGLAIAQKCEAAFKMKVHYQGPRQKLLAEAKLFHGATYHSTVDDMIPEVDCIVLAAPYTKDTHHLLASKQFSLAKREGLRVVNIARGKMIDEDALTDALESKRVVGAGLDVHDNEPGVNPKLKDNWRVTLLPHIGVCSRNSWENFEGINLDNVEAFFATGKPLTPVNNIV
jgi:lactate dehydrogenase-like 2-hydroxyacid dehydrogenase